MTALAYREFADGESWERSLDRIADVAARSHVGVVLIAVEDGRILGSATLELEDRRVDDDDPLPDQANSGCSASTQASAGVAMTAGSQPFDPPIADPVPVIRKQVCFDSVVAW